MITLPIFETKRLILRQVTEADFDSYQKNINDYEIIKHLSAQVPWPYPENGVETFIKTFVFPRLGIDRWFWGIFLKENPNEIIGAVDLFREPIPENRGFWLVRKCWGQGFMTEAVKPINDYAFNVLKFDKLILSNAVGNIASRRIKEKNGAKLIGTRPAKFVNPEYTEAETWELTKEAWFKHTRPSFIGNYRDFIDEDNAHYPNSSELLAIGSPIGRKLGLKKIGIHIETIQSGRRTSWPHAEKEEEEFAFVIKGNPEAWINGVQYPLSEGDFVAFPSGTGIAHTFINNTESDVIMLVGGEAKKATNKIFYPLNPQRNGEMKKINALWEDYPKQEMGAHDGLPDKQRNER
jgi:ribosomal-protein-alanine N-acetyltransferase